MTSEIAPVAAPQIFDFAIRVDDVDSSAKFYKSAFRMRELARLNVKNLTAVHMTDGYIYLSVVQYHSDETAESRVAGPAPCIHHFGMEVSEPTPFFPEIQNKGRGPLISECQGPNKFHRPEEILLEIWQPKYFRYPFWPEGKLPSIT